MKEECAGGDVDGEASVVGVSGEEEGVVADFVEGGVTGSVGESAVEEDAAGTADEEVAGESRVNGAGDGGGVGAAGVDRGRPRRYRRPGEVEEFVADVLAVEVEDSTRRRRK